ncbi:MAG: hypothetical protein L0Z47_10750 [Actinobacteria bacterium]|nr:hypothetical protein [Actinomycetota bacterium]MCI0677522.1 hypothetical protein [Actinomycetota bacterium]
MVRKTLMSLSAGQIDSGLSSIATFVAGLYAVSSFGTTLLGAYVVVFTAWNLARTVPSELIYTPSEVVAVGQQEARRIRVLDSSLRRGTLVSLAAAAGVLATFMIIEGDVGSEDAMALVVTAAAVTVIAPLMDHWRKMFHIAGSSWRGATTATAQMIVTISLIVALHGRLDPAWIPFGALATGYVVSALVAFLLTANLTRHDGVIPDPPGWDELSRIGRWLLLANIAVFGSDFVLALIVRAAIGPDVLGYAEGARVVARPVIILGLGLAAVLGPRSVHAGMGPDPRASRATRRLFWWVSSIGGLLYLPLVGSAWDLNPLPDILPTAYVIDGLVVLCVVGAIVFNLALPWWFELLGGRRQHQLARAEVVGSILKTGTGLLAPLLQAFTLPVAWTVAFGARAIGLDIYARRLFASPATGAGEEALVTGLDATSEG